MSAHRLFLTAAVALTSATALLADSVDAPVAEAHVSSAGHAFTLMPVPEADYAQVSLFWPGSAALSLPGKEGLYSLGPRLLFENAGGRTFDEISEDLNDAGASVIVSNILTGSVVHLQALSVDGLLPAARTADAILSDAAFDERDLRWLTSQIESGQAESGRDPGDLMDRTLTLLLANGDRRAAALTGRPFETMAAVTADDVRAWRDASFDAAPVAVAAGPMTAAEAGEAIDIALANLADRPAPVALAPLDLRVDEVTAVIAAPDAETALVAVAFPVSPTDPAVTVAIDALAGGDGTRLFRRLREEDGATYGVEATFTALTTEVMSVSLIASVPATRAGETLAALREELSDMRSGGVTEAELAAARERYAAQEDVFLRDPLSLAGIAIDQAWLGRPIAPEERRESRDMTDLGAINAALPGAIPEGVVGVIVTPDPDLVDGADCTAPIPEDLGSCR